MRSENTVLKEFNDLNYRKNPRKNQRRNFPLFSVLSNLEKICDLNSFMEGYVYVIYLSKKYKIMDIKRLNKDFLFPTDVEKGVHSVIFFKRDSCSNEGDNEEISFLLQERGLFNNSFVEDFVTCYNYRCRSLRKKIEN